MLIFLKKDKNTDYETSHPLLLIGKNKEIYVGSTEQKAWCKERMQKHYIREDNEWVLSSIAVGINHPAYNEVKAVMDKYKENDNEKYTEGSIWKK